MRLLDLPPIKRTRRNHAIEHAAVHILAARLPGRSMAGRSDAGGFFLLGNLETEDVEHAVDEALRRLPAEPELAIHPNCGTNMVVGGLIAGAAATLAVAFVPKRHRAGGLALLPRMLLAGTFASVASQPLGPAAQRRWTTLPDVAGARVGRITRSMRGRLTVHRITIDDGPPTDAADGAGDAGAADSRARAVRTP
ncbi:MAG: hypothetical protein IT332_01600 [Ardenticatenales bacterium]|nr:hypothetical protein [Ardenticatenales bacterium]